MASRFLGLLCLVRSDIPDMISIMHCLDAFGRGRALAAQEFAGAGLDVEKHAGADARD